MGSHPAPPSKRTSLHASIVNNSKHLTSARRSGSALAYTALVGTTLIATAGAQQNTLFTMTGGAANQRLGLEVGTVRNLGATQPNERTPFFFASPFLETSIGVPQRVELFSFDPQASSVAPLAPPIVNVLPPSPSSGGNETLFGASVDLVINPNGDLVGLIGAPGESSAGPAFGGTVFARNSAGNTVPFGPFGAPGDRSGTSVAILADGSGNLVGVWTGVPQSGNGKVRPVGGGSAVNAPPGALGFGASMTTIGDIDGDGIEDVVVGAPASSGGGRAYVYSGALLTNGPLAAPIATQAPSGAYQSFGFDCGPAGDVNADGIPDYWVTDPGYFLNTGRLSVFSGLSHALLYNVDGAAVGLAAGGADIDGNGTPDLIIASPAASLLATVHDGPTGAQIGVLNRALGDTNPVTAIALGDVNGDTRADAIIGQATFTPPGLPQAGQATVFEIDTTIGNEYCFSNQATGAGVFSSIYGTGTASLLNNNLVVNVSGLRPGSVGLYFAGDGTQQVMPGGGIFGTLCVGGSIGRYNGQLQTADAAGNMSLAVNWTAMPTPGSTPISALVGQTWTFQVLHSDVLPSGLGTRNLSPALSVGVL